MAKNGYRGPTPCRRTPPTSLPSCLTSPAGTEPDSPVQVRSEHRQAHPQFAPLIAPEQQLGPRHFCFHPTKDILYCSNEQGGSVSAYHFDPSAGTLKAFQTVSTLPAGYAGENLCSQVQITPSGRYLYSPNRGHDSIAGFSVDPADGVSVGLGKHPRKPCRGRSAWTRMATSSLPLVWNQAGSPPTRLTRRRVSSSPWSHILSGAVPCGC